MSAPSSKRKRFKVPKLRLRSFAHVLRRHPRNTTSDGNTGHVVSILKAINASADAFPPLKSVSSGALWIVETIQEFKSTEKDWVDFSEFLEQGVGEVLFAASERGTLPGLETHIKQLDSILTEIITDIQRILSLPKFKRVRLFLNDRERIEEYKTRLDNSLKSFNLGASLTQHEQIAYLCTLTQPIPHTLEKVKTDQQMVKSQLNRVQIDTRSIDQKVKAIEVHLRCAMIVGLFS